jgi:hypothetical protein
MVLLFAAAIFCGPLLFQQTRVMLLTVIGIGLVLGLVTLWIGWRAAVMKQPILYPFRAWSISLLEFFITPRQARELKRSVSPPASKVQMLLGLTSLVFGLALIAALIAAAVMIFA